jgi:hypothetical protein
MKDEVQCLVEEALNLIKQRGPSRELSLVRTKLEEALLWYAVETKRISV